MTEFSPMLKRPRIRPRPILVPLLIVMCGWLAFVAPVNAQTDRTILWLARDAADGTVSATLVEQTVREALGDESRLGNIVAPGDIAEIVGRGGFAIPRCLEGLDTCASASDALYAALGASMVVELVPAADGSELTVFTTLLGEETATLFYDERDLRSNVFAAVSELTGAVSMVMLRSSPVEADIYVNDELVGTTPLDVELPIGGTTLRAEADGYFAWEERIELRASERRPVDIVMGQRFSEVLVNSGTPGAWVQIDGSAAQLPIGEPHRVEPGEHVVEIHAPGCDPHVETITLGSAERATLSVVLFPSRQTLVERDMERIRNWPILLQVSGVAGGMRDELSGVRGDVFGANRRVECPASETVDDCASGSLHAQFGARLDLIYTWKEWEAGLLGVQYDTVRSNNDTGVYQLRDSSELVGIDQGSRIVVRVAQPGRRWLLDNHLEPFVRGGFAVALESWDGAELPASTAADFSRTTLLFEVHGGLRYHLNPLVHVTTQLDLTYGFGRGVGAAGVLGIGLNLPDPFGISRRISAAQEAP